MKSSLKPEKAFTPKEPSPGDEELLCKHYVDFDDEKVKDS